MSTETMLDLPYYPLPNQVGIKTSPIHGLGLFALKDIPQGIELGITHIKHQLFQNGWIRTPLGGFYNHCENPNCFITDQLLEDDTSVKILVTLKHIPMDTELTCKYSLWDINSLLRHNLSLQ